MRSSRSVMCCSVMATGGGDKYISRTSSLLSWGWSLVIRWVCFLENAFPKATNSFMSFLLLVPPIRFRFLSVLIKPSPLIGVGFVQASSY